jgi:hypothetical protein
MRVVSAPWQSVVAPASRAPSSRSTPRPSSTPRPGTSARRMLVSATTRPGRWSHNALSALRFRGEVSPLHCGHRHLEQTGEADPVSGLWRGAAGSTLPPPDRRVVTGLRTRMQVRILAHRGRHRGGDCGELGGRRGSGDSPTPRGVGCRRAAGSHPSRGVRLAPLDALPPAWAAMDLHRLLAVDRSRRRTSLPSRASPPLNEGRPAGAGGRRSERVEGAGPTKLPDGGECPPLVQRWLANGPLRPVR